MIGLWLSALSAITALIGLVSSLWLGWRKERREVAQHLLELERTRLEVEKLQRDLGEIWCEVRASRRRRRQRQVWPF